MNIRCSLHNHTYNSDGDLGPEALLTYLYNEGFSVVAITDHQKRTIPWDLRVPEDFLFIDGIEWWHPYLGCEIVSLGFDAKEVLLGNAKVSWIAHPYWLIKDYSFTIERIAKTIELNENICGLELYNDGLKQLSVDELEYLSDYNVNYYAVDDLHIPEQINQGWIEMEVDSLDKDTVLENLVSGDYWMAIRNP